MSNHETHRILAICATGFASDQHEYVCPPEGVSWTADAVVRAAVDRDANRKAGDSYRATVYVRPGRRPENDRLRADIEQTPMFHAVSLGL